MRLSSKIIGGEGGRHVLDLVDADGDRICTVVGLKRANEIVRAVNAHDALVALATDFRAWLINSTHEQLCNGVHADNGACEGEAWAAQAQAKIDAALALAKEAS